MWFEKSHWAPASRVGPDGLQAVSVSPPHGGGDLFVIDRSVKAKEAILGKFWV